MNYKNPIPCTRHLNSIHSEYSIPTTLLEFHHESISRDQRGHLLPGSSQGSGLHPPSSLLNPQPYAKSTYSAKIARPTFARKMTAFMGYATYINKIYIYHQMIYQQLHFSIIYSLIRQTAAPSSVLQPLRMEMECTNAGNTAPTVCTTRADVAVLKSFSSIFWQTHLLCSMADQICPCQLAVLALRGRGRSPNCVRPSRNTDQIGCVWNAGRV